MFTGIVQGKAVIAGIEGQASLKTTIIQFPHDALKNISKGASIAINGTCLTVTHINMPQDQVSFDVIEETLESTNLRLLSQGDTVNFERAASIGDEIGGHLMSGHVHCTCEVTRIEKSESNQTVYMKTPEEFRKYLLPKGFAGLNGCSLTLGKTIDSEFCVHLIPETLEVTTFGQLKKGSVVNLEIDPQTQTIVDTVERVLADKN